MNYTTQQFQAGQVLRASQLNAMDNAIKTSMKSALPVEVNLGKQHIGVIGTHVTVHAKGLEPNTDYALQLFRYSQTKHVWDIMWDDTTGQSNFGWAFLKGKVRSANKKAATAEYFTEEVPDWMPNAGVLQSRWLFSTTASESERLITFTPTTWILDALKPIGCNWDDAANCGILGARSNRHASIKIKAGIMQKMSNGSFQLVGMSTATFNFYRKGLNTLSVSNVADTACANISVYITQ